MNTFLGAICEEKLQMTESQLQQIAKQNGFDLSSPQYRVMIVASPHPVSSPDDFQRYCIELPRLCDCFFTERKLRASVDTNFAGRCIVLAMDDVKKNSVEKYAPALLAYLDAHRLPASIVAIGKCVSSLADVALSYKTAVNALNYQSLYSGERCLFCEDMQAMMHLSTLQSVVSPNLMMEAFQAGDMEALRLLVTSYAEKVRALSGESVEGRHPTSIRHMFAELTVYMLHIASDMGVDVDAILNGVEPYNYLLANDKSTPMIIDWFIGMCSDLRKAINEKTNSKELTTIHQVCDYIDAHITRYDLSLEDAAAAVNMTSSYLSKLFHKEMGLGFSKFIVQARLNIARKLLIETELSMKEISEQSGFASANYFGTVFKKEFGISPLAYRAQNTSKGES